MKLRLFLFAGFRAETADGHKYFLPKKAEALLSYLALNSQPQMRDKLATLFWGDSPNEHARKSLRQTLFVIRKTLEKPLGVSLFHSEGETITFNAVDVEVDVLRFQDLVRRDDVTALRLAADLYQGDLLEGLAVTEPSFDEWLICERERLHELLVQTLGKTLAHDMASHEHERAIQTALRLLAVDPLQESVHRCLMRLYAEQQRWGFVQRQYQVCIDALRAELNTDPEAETSRLYNEILSGRAVSPIEQDRTPLSNSIAAASVAGKPSRAAFRTQGGRYFPAALIGAFTLLTLLVGLLLWPKSEITPEIAVLPFQNASGAGPLDEIALELTDSLITKLSALDGLRVRSMNAVIPYAQSNQEPVMVGRQLGVGTLIEGRVRSRGEGFRVTIQLVSARDGSTLWAGEFDSAMEYIPSFEDLILEKLTARLTPSGVEKQLLAAGAELSETHDHYWKGQYRRIAATENACRQAIDEFNKVIDADPRFALAYVGLADCYLELAALGSPAPSDLYAKARAAALKAVALDSDLAEAHVTLGRIQSQHEWNWREAETELRKAIQLKPNHAEGYHWYSHLLVSMGRTEESLIASKTALALEPLNIRLRVHLGWHYIYAREYDKAIAQLQDALEMDPRNASGHLYLAKAYIHRGSAAEAIEPLRNATALLETATHAEAKLAIAFALQGQSSEAESIVSKLQDLAGPEWRGAYSIASIWAALGDVDRALRWLEHAYESRSSQIPYLAADPVFEAVRSDSRYHNLIQRIGLDQFPHAN